MEIRERSVRDQGEISQRSVEICERSVEIRERSVRDQGGSVRDHWINRYIKLNKQIYR